MATILEVCEVRKNYHMGKVVVPALRGVSFDVEKGEFLAIFGPSGGGKSTLLHLMGCLDRPDKGKILIDGSNILKLSDDKLAELRLTKMGFVFQFFNLLPRLTSLRNVELPLTIAGLPEKETSKRANEMLKLVGLEGRMDHRPFELSGGEQQRVAMARALINDPKIVLADEPTGNLDTKTGWEIVELMKKLNKEKGQTFVVVTHDPHIAEAADRIIHLKDGLIEEIKKAPRRNKQ
ncbi:ABC transporter ATP-binding protein [Candidatus Bathyarchaeota archaeon]|nr:ABC transporter ATP-binding protein [Candidatus Bathyarchaeota archaeon]